MPPSYWRTRRHSNHSKDVELTINDKKAEADGEESSADGVAVDDGVSLDGDNALSGSSKSLAILRQILRDGLDFSLLKTLSFSVYCCCTVGMVMGLICFLFHTPNRALDCGIPLELIAAFPSVIGVSQLVTSLVFGMLSDTKCVNRCMMFSVGVILGGVVEIASTFVTDYNGLLICCSLFGSCCGQCFTYSLYQSCRAFIFMHWCVKFRVHIYFLV